MSVALYVARYHSVRKNVQQLVSRETIHDVLAGLNPITNVRNHYVVPSLEDVEEYIEEADEEWRKQNKHAMRLLRRLARFYEGQELAIVW